MRRVTADTNVYVSALNFHGPPHAFLRLTRDGLIRLALSQATLDEVVDVLDRNIHWTTTRLGAVRKTLLTYTERVAPTVILDVVKEMTAF